MNNFEFSGDAPITSGDIGDISGVITGIYDDIVNEPNPIVKPEKPVIIVGPDLGKPDVKEKDAKSIVDTQIANLVDKWGKVNPRGTVKLPASRLKAYETVYLPARVAITGPRDELIVQDLWGIYAREGFKQGDDFSDQFVLASRRAPNNKRNSNANFDARLERLMVQALPGHASSGILWGGAQSSTIRDVCIWDAENFALCLDYGTSRIHLDSINIRNGNSSPSRTKTFGVDRRPRGVGIRMPACRGVSGANIALHLCKVGFDLYGTHCVDIGNVMCEKVDLILRAEGSSVINLRGIDIQASGRGEYPNGLEWDHILFDFKKHQGLINITGRVRDTPSPVFYLDRRGKKQVLFESGTDSPSGRSFAIHI